MPPRCNGAEFRLACILWYIQGRYNGRTRYEAIGFTRPSKRMYRIVSGFLDLDCIIIAVGDFGLTDCATRRHRRIRLRCPSINSISFAISFRFPITGWQILKENLANCENQFSEYDAIARLFIYLFLFSIYIYVIKSYLEYWVTEWRFSDNVRIARILFCNIDMDL